MYYILYRMQIQFEEREKYQFTVWKDAIQNILEGKEMTGLSKHEAVEEVGDVKSAEFQIRPPKGGDNGTLILSI